MSFSLTAYSRAREVFDPETEMVLVFLTNNLDLGATTIAAIYKDRWQMEIFPASGLKP